MVRQSLFTRVSSSFVLRVSARQWGLEHIGWYCLWIPQIHTPPFTKNALELPSTCPAGPGPRQPSRFRRCAAAPSTNELSRRGRMVGAMPLCGAGLWVRLILSLLLQWLRGGHLHHQLSRGLSVCGGELQGQHHRGGEPQAAAEDPSGESSWLCRAAIDRPYQHALKIRLNKPQINPLAFF